MLHPNSSDSISPVVKRFKLIAKIWPLFTLPWHDLYNPMTDL